jgi:hypothetical protein
MKDSNGDNSTAGEGYGTAANQTDLDKKNAGKPAGTRDAELDEQANEADQETGLDKLEAELTKKINTEFPLSGGETDEDL